MANQSAGTPRRRSGKRTAGKGAKGVKSGKTRGARQTSGERAGTSPWEWAIAAVGGLILAAIIGFLVYEAVARPPQIMPEIVATGGEVLALANGMFLVPITVSNAGHATGAGVTVSGALVGEDGAVIEESAVTFDFVAQHSDETGGLYFTADPRLHRLVMRVEGYDDP